MGRDFRSLSTCNHDVRMFNRTNWNFFALHDFKIVSRRKGKHPPEINAAIIRLFPVPLLGALWPLCSQ